MALKNSSAVIWQVLSLKSIQFTITDSDFAAIACLEELEEVVLDCDQPPEGQGQSEEAKWGLLHFPEAMKQLTNMTHLTLSCHYGITALPQGISRLSKLEVRPATHRPGAQLARFAIQVTILLSPFTNKCCGLQHPLVAHVLQNWLRHFLSSQVVLSRRCCGFSNH